MKTKINLAMSALTVLIVSLTLISAFGVSSPYWSDKPLKMARGETTIVNLNLQNMVGEDDVDVSAELVDGEEIASIPSERYTVEAGTADTIVPLKIKMPKDASPGESKRVSVEFKTISGDTGGISMGTGMTISFNAIATEDIKDNTVIVVSIIIAILVLAIIVWMVLKRKKKR